MNCPIRFVSSGALRANGTPKSILGRLANHKIGIDNNQSISNINNRLLSSHSHPHVTSEQIIYKQFGDPSKVLQLGHDNLHGHRHLMPGQVRIKWLACPINPADLNMIQGVYALKPALPAVGGNEGVAVVEQIGENVVQMSPGDWVIPLQAALGTWQTHQVVQSHALMKIQNSLPLDAAATLMVNPPTAYRMLHDFVQLKPGDVIIQNGANSAVGRFVIQIARLNQWKTVNLIRDREDTSIVERTKTDLTELGADLVLTEREFKRQSRNIWTDSLHKPKLALNCVGGDSTLLMAVCLQEQGQLVTYGGMSMQPLKIPTAAFIFKRIELHGFWMSHWYSQPQNHTEAVRMIGWLSEQINNKRLVSTKCAQVPWKEFQSAIQHVMRGSLDKKILIF